MSCLFQYENNVFKPFCAFVTASLSVTQSQGCATVLCGAVLYCVLKGILCVGYDRSLLRQKYRRN
jgi:hypothetical protein